MRHALIRWCGNFEGIFVKPVVSAGEIRQISAHGKRNTQFGGRGWGWRWGYLTFSWHMYSVDIALSWKDNIHFIILERQQPPHSVVL